MSGIPSGVAVLRYVPQHLIDGFNSGELKLSGSVLRRASGPGRGQIAGFLTEGWDVIQKIEQNLPIDADSLKAVVGNAQMATQLAAGIGMLNLGVQVAGFAMVMRRLNEISGRIETVHKELRAVGQNVDWLARLQIAGLRADAENAIATAERAARQKDRVLLNNAKTSGDRVRRHLMNVCDDMLVTGRAVPQQALFEEFMNLGVLLAYAEARCDDAVEGAGQAAQDLFAVAQQLRRLSDGFRDQVRNFGSNPLELLRIGDAGRAATKAVSQRVGGIVERLESYVPQLELQHALGLDQDGWRALVAGEGSGAITCITTEGKPEADLLELVLARASAI